MRISFNLLLSTVLVLCIHFTLAGIALADTPGVVPGSDLKHTQNHPTNPQALPQQLPLTETQALEAEAAQPELDPGFAPSLTLPAVQLADEHFADPVSKSPQSAHQGKAQAKNQKVKTGKGFWGKVLDSFWLTKLLKPLGKKGNTDGNNVLAILSLVFGLVGFVTKWFIPFGPILFLLAGLILGILGLKSSKRGLALAGLIISAIGLFIYLLVIVGIYKLPAQ